MKQEPKGGFQPPEYLCMHCGSVNYAPKWENIAEPKIPEDEASEAWISQTDMARISELTNGQLN